MNLDPVLSEPNGIQVHLQRINRDVGYGPSGEHPGAHWADMQMATCATEANIVVERIPQLSFSDGDVWHAPQLRLALAGLRRAGVPPLARRLIAGFLAADAG